ncbi:hypothetical protein GCM10010464_31860 [Pseudonocardia yunnanensis]|uniref:Histidine phosphatase family protein n=1 Tax=Pseudonocardia yunnanensis TaxID=58107 RepID=A0ABW4F6Q4_9PSEU
MTASGHSSTQHMDEPQGDQVIMIIRHAEKPIRSDGPHGVTPEGEADKHSLTVTGWIRAGALAGLFSPPCGDAPTGLCRPRSIYGPTVREGHSKRSVQTVMPLAARLGLDVITRYATGDEVRLARELSGRPGATLVAWRHESIHTIAEHLGEITPAPPAHWPADRYDVVWTFSRNGDGWQFAQVPLMILPGDLPYPIAELVPAEPRLG